jgi:predicted metal-binding membrane protein
MTVPALYRPGRAEAGRVALLLALAAAGWALTDERMSGMAAGPGSELGDVGCFSISWLLMMAAMMLPAITPMAVAYSRRSTPGGATAAFAAGYLVTWVAAGLLGDATVLSRGRISAAGVGAPSAGRRQGAGGELSVGRLA